MPEVPPFAIALAIGSGISFLFAGLAWNKRGDPGAVPLVVFHVAIAIGTGTYALEIVATDVHQQVLFLKLWLFAQAFVPPTWLFAAIEYSGRARWATRRTAALLAIEPLAFGAVLVVPTLRQYVFTLPASGAVGSLVPTRVDMGLLSVSHYVYLFVLALGGSALLVQLFLRSRHMYRTQAAAVLIAATAPFTTVLAQALGLSPSTDPSALTWAVSGVALTAGLYRFKTLDPVPAGRSAIVEEMGDGAVVLDEDNVISDGNPAAERLLADGDTELVGRHITDVVEDWRDVPGVPTETTTSTDQRSARRGDLDTGTGVPESDGGTEDWYEFSRTVDGRQKHLEVQASPFTDRFDRHVGTMAVVRDVTQRKEREESLARYKTVLESTREKVYVLDGDDRFRIVNQSLADFLDHDADELVGEPFETVLSTDSQMPPRSDQSPLSDDWGAITEIEVETAGGDIVPCETRLTPVEFGDVSGSVGFIRDISRRKQVEADLETTSETLETLVEASPLAVVATDLVGAVETWNPAATAIFGYEPDEVLGDSAPIIPDDEQERVERLYERVAEGQRLTDIEIPLERKSGEQLAASVSMAPLRDANEEVQGIVSIIADVTERKERERELEETNARLEQFASVVSHDLRNPLQVALTYVEHIVDTDDTAHAEDALDALFRMESLIDDVLTLARQGRDIGETEPTALETVVERAWNHVETDSAHLEVGSLPMVEGDANRLQELFENLFRNAVEHGGESVTIIVADHPDRDGILVVDDGPGIPADDRDDVLEPGFTTAADGTGLGLPIVRSIAEAHGWTVRVRGDDVDPSSLAVPVTDPGAVSGACFEFVFADQ
jgi:PAS domain S-box-containing protein